METLTDRQGTGEIDGSGAVRDCLICVQSREPFRNDARRHFERARHENTATINATWGGLYNTYYRLISVRPRAGASGRTGREGLVVADMQHVPASILQLCDKPAHMIMSENIAATIEDDEFFQY